MIPCQFELAPSPDWADGPWGPTHYGQAASCARQDTTVSHTRYPRRQSGQPSDYLHLEHTTDLQTQSEGLDNIMFTHSPTVGLVDGQLLAQTMPAATSEVALALRWTSLGVRSIMSTVLGEWPSL